MGLEREPSLRKILLNSYRVPGTAQSPEVLNKSEAEPERAGFVQPGAEAAGTVQWPHAWPCAGVSLGGPSMASDRLVTAGKILSREDGQSQDLEPERSCGNFQNVTGQGPEQPDHNLKCSLALKVAVKLDQVIFKGFL